MRDTLLITLGFPPARGGIQSCLYERCGLAADRMVVLAPHHPEASRFDRAQPFPIYRWPAVLGQMPGLKRAAQFLFTLLYGWRLCRQYPIRRLECGQALPFGMVGRLLRQRLGIPYRVWAYGDDIIKPARSLRRLLLSCLKDADQIVAISRFSARLLGSLGLAESQVQVIYPLVDLRRFRAKDDAATLAHSLGLPAGPKMLTVARLERRKGVDVVLRLLPALVEAHPNLHYVVVGDGPDRSGLISLVEQLGLMEHVFFAGNVSMEQLPAYYAACDLFVLLSTPHLHRGEAEGLGIVYLEAAASGRPCVAWRTGGVEEAVVAGRTGLLVDYGDLDGARAAIDSLLSAPPYAAHLGQRGRAFAEEMVAESARRLRRLDGYDK